MTRPRGALLSVEECVYWLAVVAATSSADTVARAAQVAAVCREPRVLKLWADASLRSLRKARRVDWDRLPHLATWALCRAAIRAIEGGGR